jgi:group II intron reverse transcriptase/maturase
MSLSTPESLQKLWTALHAKAKESPSYRFYTLYDKVYRPDVLLHAYACCKANQGAAGVDGQDFADIEKYGLDRWLGELAEKLKGKTYEPAAVRRVYIPKAGQPGKFRPLGIPCIRDRVVQMAAVLVLEPIFEADLQPEQYAYRPARSALDAVRYVHSLLNTGHGQVIDADLSGYFDSVPHAELMRCLARRIVDRAMLHLIKMWLEAPVEEDDGQGKKHRTTGNRDEGRGTPQGAPISPMLSNLYMRRFVLGWKALGHERRLDAHIVNYADDCAPRRRERMVA